MPIIDELLVGLGFEFDPKEADEFKKKLDNTVGSIKTLTKVAVSAAVAITGLTIATTAASDEQGKLAAEIGDTVENIDALQFASKRSGAGDISGSLRQLSIRAAEAARGVGSGVEAFGLLGLSVVDVNGKLKPTTQLMQEIATEFEGLNKAKQIELADKLGLSNSIRLLQRGRGSIAELVAEARELGVTTEEDAAIAADFQNTLTDFWQIVKQISRTLTRAFVPILQEMTTGFTEWWKVNKDLIALKVPEWIDTFTKAVKFLTIAIGAFIAFRLIGHLLGIISLMKTLTVATLAANAAAFLLPALIAAAIVAVIALAEDAKVFFEGGESFIGDMIAKFPKWTSELQIVASVFASLADLTITIFDGWSKIFELFNTGKFLETIKGLTSDQFILDALGLVNVGGGGLVPETGAAISNATSTFIDRVEIAVTTQPGAAGVVAQELFGLFQQTDQDLQTTVDQ